MNEPQRLFVPCEALPIWRGATSGLVPKSPSHSAKTRTARLGRATAYRARAALASASQGSASAPHRRGLWLGLCLRPFGIHATMLPLLNALSLRLGYDRRDGGSRMSTG